MRKGFTLFDWIDYLVNREAISSKIYDTISSISKKYNDKCITHDDYAKYACSEYSKAVRKHSFAELDTLAKEYLVCDMKQIFGGMGRLFNLLYQKDIDIIVISGAPEIILRHYKEKYHLSDIYAFKECVVDGIITGQVAYNYGYNKEKAIDMLITKYGSGPLLAFGDSSSDVPLLNEAKYGFAVNNMIVGAETIYTPGNAISDMTIDMIAHIIQ